MCSDSKRPLISLGAKTLKSLKVNNLQRSFLQIFVLFVSVSSSSSSSLFFCVCLSYCCSVSSIQKSRCWCLGQTGGSKFILPRSLSVKGETGPAVTVCVHVTHPLTNTDGRTVYVMVRTRDVRSSDTSYRHSDRVTEDVSPPSPNPVCCFFSVPLTSALCGTDFSSHDTQRTRATGSFTVRAGRDASSRSFSLLLHSWLRLSAQSPLAAHLLAVTAVVNVSCRTLSAVDVKILIEL